MVFVENQVVTVGLAAIFFIVLLGPFLYKRIEHNLELFLFIMGVTAITLNTMILEIAANPAGEVLPIWNWHLVERAIADPIEITLAVWLAGLLFHYGRTRVHHYMTAVLKVIPIHIIVFLTVVSLGLLSSIITAIIAALLLAEIISILRLPRKAETGIVVLACFSIGLGAALTPVGEPLSTIVIKTKLNEHFWFLFQQLGKYILPGIVALGFLSLLFVQSMVKKTKSLTETEEVETLKDVGVRAFKVYIFVMALVFLGTGFAPIIEWYIKFLAPEVLYWVNISSAILDNATLASAEVSKGMTVLQLNSILMALLITGGMLIPGNIPNIIAANKLKITSKEWARIGVPLGLVMMVVYYAILFWC